jgi:hypothetical protein
MKKENNNIKNFLNNYNIINLGLDIGTYIDKNNQMNLFFSLNMVKEDKKKSTFSSKRNRLIEKNYISVDMNDKSINVDRIINREIKRILKKNKGSKLVIYTKENSLENEIISKTEHPLIRSKKIMPANNFFNELKLFFESNEFELKKINEIFNKNLKYLDVTTYSDKSLKMNYLKIEEYNSKEDLLNKNNKLDSEEFFYNCTMPHFQKKCFDLLLKKIKNKSNEKFAIRTNFTGKNHNLFNNEDLVALDSFMSNADNIGNYFGTISENNDLTELEQSDYKIKIMEQSDRKMLERTDLSKYNVLYTDGSTFKDKEEKVYLSSGAFILDTENKDSLKGVNVEKTNGGDYGEVMGAYFGILEVVNNKLFDKPLSLIMDSDNLSISIENSLKGLPLSEINLHSNHKFREMMKLIKENELEIKTFIIKSHINSKDDIYLKNKEVDMMAINSIKKKLEENNTPNKLKKRKMI